MGSIIKKLFYLVVVSLLTNYVFGRADKFAGGKPIRREQFPYFVQIVTISLDKNGDIAVEGCGGSLIHPQWVLSAAHCFKNRYVIPPENFKNGLVRAYMGTKKVVVNHFNDTTLTFQSIQEAYTHNDYTYEELDDSEDMTNDVAVALLKQPFVLDNYITTIRLPDLSAELCALGTVIGGEMVDFNGKTGNTLKYADVHSKTDEELSEEAPFPRSTVFYTEVSFYRGHPLEADTGGPFVCTDRLGPIQYGILSSGYTTSTTSIDEYEKVTEHLWFIRKYVREGLHHKTLRSRKIHKQNEKRPQTMGSAVCIKLSYIIWCTSVILYTEYALSCIRVS